MNKNNYVLPTVFTPTALKVIEFFLRKNEEGDNKKYNLLKFAKEAGISVGALHNTIKVLEENGIIVTKDIITNGGKGKVIEIDWKNELVYVMMQSFSAFLKWKNGGFSKK